MIPVTGVAGFMMMQARVSLREALRSTNAWALEQGVFTPAAAQPARL
jgi:hypothetical protein